MEKTTITKVVGKSAVESRVRKRIEALKKSDLEGRKSMEKPEQMIPLEDLYEVPVPVVQNDEIPENLRKTLRIIEEKNVLIDQLRSSCYDLALKYADAENRIDQLRFGGGRSAAVKSQSMQNLNFNLNAISLGHNCTDAGEMSFLNYTTNTTATTRNVNKRYSTSEIPRAIEGQQKSQIVKCKKTITNLPELTNIPAPDTIITTTTTTTATGPGIPNQIDKKDQSTETELKIPTTTPSNVSQLSGDLEQITPGQNPIDSNCSNWLEKVQNWKTLDSTKSQDSCEFDSGFKGSATTVIVPLPVTVTNLNICKKTEISGGNDTEIRPNTSTTAASKDKGSRKNVKMTTITNCNSSDSNAQLDLLLDEATIIAKRVKKKSQKLAQMLKELEIDSSNNTNNTSISNNKIKK